MGIFSSRNSATGWYSYGTAYSNSDSLWEHKPFQSGDQVGLVVDMAALTVQFYLNGEVVGSLIDISWVRRDLHAICLLGAGGSVRLRYLGSQLPPKHTPTRTN